MNQIRLTPGAVLIAAALLAGCSDGSGPSERRGLRYQQVVAGDGYTCGLTTTWKTFCWGTTVVSSDTIPQAVVTPEPLAKLAMGAGNFNQALCGLSTTGKIYCWGYYLGGTDVGDVYGDGVSAVTMADSFDFSDLAAGNGHVCAIATTGATICWGSYLYGKRGLDAAYPVDCSNGGSCFADLKANQVSGAGPTFTSLAAGDQQTCGVTGAGNVYCWGDSLAAGSPQATVAHADSLCWPSPSCTMVPGPLVSLTGIKAAAAGGPHTCAVTQSGVLYCWGWNYYGEVGTGSTVNQPTPVHIQLEESVSMVTAGAYHTCAIGTSGSVYCWGTNWGGQLGTAPGADVPTPRKMTTSLKFVGLAAGTGHTCGITDEGFLYCWGDNQRGELGTGNHTPSPVPVRVKEPGV